MAGDRPFDDDRFPDQEGFACCFLCGRPVDPRDKQRGSYTPYSLAWNGAAVPRTALLRAVILMGFANFVANQVAVMAPFQMPSDAALLRYSLAPVRFSR